MLEMKLAISAGAKAVIHWVGPKRYHEPWLRYNPTFCAEHIPELNMQSATWDIVVRSLDLTDALNRQFLITFQFASARMPHHLLTPGLDFWLYEGVCVWHGFIDDIFAAPRDPGYWYSGDNPRKA